MPTIIDVTGLQNALIGTTDISDIGDGTITSALVKHNENFAVEETSPTTAAHEIGEYITWKGTLYRVKTAISAGEALEVGLNIVKKTTVGVTEDLAGSIATIETSPATANHAVGEYIVYNGQLYKVTTAITAGQSLTVGTNISAVSVASELNAVESKLASFKQSESIVTSSPTVQNTMADTGVTFTLDRIAYVTATLVYGNSRPIAIGITTGVANQPPYVAFTSTDGNTNAGQLTCSAILPAGTYRIYAKALSAATNGVKVTANYLP